jgi:type I restriction enzyme, S subunit
VRQQLRNKYVKGNSIMSVTLSRLDDVCEIIMGQAPSGAAYNKSGNGWMLIAGAGDFGEIYPAPKKFTTEASKLSNPGDIILGIRATIGEKVLSNGEYCLGRGVAALRSRTGLNSRYLWHWLEHIRPELCSKSKGATFKQVNRQDIAELKISLLPIDQQKRIAAILDKAEELRRLRRQSIEQLDILGRSIFIEMFGWARDKEKNISLGEHLNFLTSGGRGWAKFYSTKGSRFIRSLDVQTNYISDEDPTYVNPPDNAEAKRTIVSPGDVLLTITGSRIGRVAPVKEEIAGGFISQHVAILRPDPKSINSIFLSFFLNMPTGGQRQIAKVQYGQTKPGLNFEQINNFKIPVASLSRQQEFAQQIEAIEHLKSQHRESLAQLDKLFASLQHRAFRGEL